MANGLHLLKLVMGVDISTRPVRKSGRDGKPRKSSIRNAAAEDEKLSSVNDHI